jgi:hypothetical protein
MSTLIVIGLSLAALVAAGIAGVARNRVRQHGLFVIVWRFLSGQAWHGKPVTDAGWIRPGIKALTRTGHASRFHHMPRWRRALRRTGSTSAAGLALYGLVVARTVTVWAAAAAAGGLLLYGAWRSWQGVLRFRHRRIWVRPLHAALAPVLGVPLPAKPESWLSVERDRSKATVHLPPGPLPDERERAAIAAAAAAKLGLEAPDTSWRLTGPRPQLALTAAKPPPANVPLGALRTQLEQASQDTIVLGLGKGGTPVTVSLAGDSPHLGLSMASGGGKSIAARLIGAQLLHRGGLVIVLDPKRISHAWARGLPNVAYAADAATIHATLLLLAREVARRNEVAEAAADVEGEVHADVGPRVLIIAEELNTMQQRLKAYWRDIRSSSDPSRSPAAEALDEVLFTGRQVRCNVLMVGQRLSAAASGTGDARENLAARVLGRYTTSTWKMLCPEHPPPPSSRTPGRVQVVTHTVRECQIGFLSGAEARDYATSGVIARDPAHHPKDGRPRRDHAVPRRREAAGPG